MSNDWMEVVMENFTQHLIDAHGSHMPAWDLHQEQNFMEEFLFYESWREGIHTIRCPCSDCDWEQKFELEFKVQLKLHP